MSKKIYYRARLSFMDNTFEHEIEIDLFGMTTERLTKRLSGEIRVFVQSINKELEMK